VLDIEEKDMKWAIVNLEKVEGVVKNQKPKPRENAAMIYDPQESRLIIYGGWANNWLNDMWSLNVSSITGPPYAIFSIEPMLGPITGRTKVTITGEGFKNSGNINVKFTSGKFEKEVPGNYVSDTVLEA
jgi:dynein heavy chain